MRQVTQNASAQLVAIIVDQGTGTARDGLTFSDVQVEYRRSDELSFTLKTLAPGDWVGLGNGAYQVTFTGTELRALGSFLFAVRGQPSLSPAIQLFVGEVEVVTDATSTTANLPTCTITGNLLDPSGAAVEGAGVSARMVGPPVVMGGTASIGLTTESVGATTDKNGFFVLTLIQGGRFEVSIPSINYRRILTVPVASSAQLFEIP